MRRQPALLVRALALLWALCALAVALPASAQPRVWLDRDRIAFDETVTMSLEIDTKHISAMPDLVQLGHDFRILDQRMQQQVAWINGVLTAQVTMELTLSPLREGQIEIRSLWRGRDATPSLYLTVLPPRNPQFAARPPPVSAAPEQPVFIETLIDDEAPYVQQTVGFALRLYYPASVQIEGRLDQEPPAGASLQKVGDEVPLKTTIGNIQYTAIERRYLLIPERSGTITLPPARFQGRTLGMFDSVFDTSRKELTVISKPVALQVKPIPAAATQPWLPLRGLRMRYAEMPQSLQVGKSAAVTVEVVAEGGTAAQMPAVMVQAGNDAQVFAEPAQIDDRFLQGRPQATIVRRFLVLPTREGTLRIVAPRIVWWDTQAGIARTTSLPDLTLRVAPGAARSAASMADTASANDDEVRGWREWIPGKPWLWAGIALVLLWSGALFLGWRLWSLRAATGATASPQRAHRSGSSSSANDPQRLASALARGDLGAIVQALCAAPAPAAGDLDAVRARLADPPQRAAVDALQRARWGDGDNAATLAALRTAFASGPRWRTSAARAEPVLLPPLYPER